jgi:type II restriction/modification system DNA methylase subunit YeeA
MDAIAPKATAPTSSIDTGALKKFAQEARRVLRDQVSAKLTHVLVPESAARREEPEAVKELESEIRRTSHDQVIERVAYTWFNRFTALRFMDANDYTTVRIITPAEGDTRPELLSEAMAGSVGEETPKAIAEKVRALLENRTPSHDPQGEAYRLLLVSVCNHWHGTMPFMFETIADYTELLMPEDLLSPNSILARMRGVMTDDACKDVEIIGWLYQFYISEKKEQVFTALKKNVKITPENIPAATQLFTPHWIVRYLVENSLGRLWLLNRPHSNLAAQMDYFIPSEEPETDFLRISRPEEIRICDPACGSGHMLTYAFDLLYAIYEEEGYDPVEIPGLILKHNLTGIEIDERAGALAAFALAMKAAAKLGRRRFLRMEVQPNICVLQTTRMKLPEFNEFVERLGHTLAIEKLAARISKAPLAIDAIWKHVSRYLDACTQDRFIDESGEYVDHLLESVSSEVELYEEASKNPFLLDQYKLATLDLLKIAKQDKAQAKRKDREGQFRKVANAETLAARLAAIGHEYERHRNDTTYRMDLEALAERLFEAAAAPEELARLEALQTTLAETVRFHAPLWVTVRQFEQAKNFGSLIVPRLHDPAETLRLVEARDFASDLLLKDVQDRVITVLRMAKSLSPKYHVVVANPPYLGSKGMNGSLGNFAKANYTNSKSDLFAMFIERNLDLAEKHGAVAMITMQSWMFLSSFEALRTRLLGQNTLLSMSHLGARAFDSIGGEVVSTTAFVLESTNRSDYKGGYIRLVDGNSEAEKNDAIRDAVKNPNCGWVYRASAADFKKIPGSPIAYWFTNIAFAAFEKNKRLEMIAKARRGLSTGDNERFIRFWHEVSFSESAQSSSENPRWYPYHKGGAFRRWFGNNDLVVDWGGDGKNIKGQASKPSGDRGWRTTSEEYYLRSGITWTGLAAGDNSFRFSPKGFLFDTNKGPMAFPSESKTGTVLCFLNSRPTSYFLSALNPTLSTQNEDIDNLPFVEEWIPNCGASSERLVAISKSDWDVYETSWDYRTLPLLLPDRRAETLEGTYARMRTSWREMTLEMQRLEKENNRIFIDAYGLQDELNPEVPLEQITLTCNPAYRYGGRKSEVELEELLLADTMREFLSYAVGCMFGRYSLDVPGLILANQGDGIVEYLAKIPNPTFEPDSDNVIPVLDGDWFSDDITERFRKFLRATFGEDKFRENLAFIEEALGKDIRKYFTRDFYNDHVRRYKKRPIYWMFSSPKGTFNALIYVHRYRPDTVNVVLNDYLREFRRKLQEHRRAQEALSISGEATPAQKTNALKEIEATGKQIEELDSWERNVLFPLATRKIEIDLDDGVKANYPKFGEALKAIKGLNEAEE